MDFPIHIDTIRIELSIVYLKESQVDSSKLVCISVPEGCFNLSNQCRPGLNSGLCCILSGYSLFARDNASFYLGLHCLQEYPFRDFQYTKG